jgi:AraC-like DNA-binding protein
MADPPQGRFHFWGDRALYLGWDLPATVHAHHAVQVCIGLSGPIRLRTGPGARWEDYACALVPSDQPHVSELVPGTAIATLWLEPGSRTATRFARRPDGGGGDAIIRLPCPRFADVVPDLLDCWRRDADSRRAAELVDSLVERLAPPDAPPPPPIDARVARAREVLEGAPDRRAPLAEVAAAVALSPSRLAHLFRAEVGLPPRRYLLWLRLRDAIGELASGASITDAAHAAGFADGPHFTRTFRRMLGFTPADALRVSRFIQDAPSASR